MTILEHEYSFPIRRFKSMNTGFWYVDFGVWIQPSDMSILEYEYSLLIGRFWSMSTTIAWLGSLMTVNTDLFHKLTIHFKRQRPLYTYNCTYQVSRYFFFRKNICVWNHWFEHFIDDRRVQFGIFYYLQAM